MKNEKFVIVNLIKELIVNVDKNLVNFPKKEIEIKREIVISCYSLLRKAYEANTTTNTEKRVDLQENMIATIKYIDFFMNVCYDKQIINSKKYLRFGESLENIIRYVPAWKNATIKGKENIRA